MKNKLVLLAMAFSLIFINCGENPEEKGNQESTVTYAGGSGETATVITITAAADGTKTYVIMYGGETISSGSVVIDEDGTMIFTPEGGGETFTAETTGDGAVPSFTGPIPIVGGEPIPIPELVEQSALSFEVVAMQVYLFDSVGDGKGDGKTPGGSYNVLYTDSDEDVIGEINDVSIGKVGTITDRKISVKLTSLKDSQLGTLGEVWKSATTTTSGLKVGNLELRPSEDDHYFGLTHPITMAGIMYFNKDGDITVEGKTLQVKRGWNFLTLTDIEISQNIQDVYNKGYRWIYYNINHND